MGSQKIIASSSAARLQWKEARKAGETCLSYDIVI